MPSFNLKTLAKWRFPLIVFSLLLVSTSLMVLSFDLSNRASDESLSENLSETLTEVIHPKQPAYVDSDAFGMVIYGLWSPSFTQIRTVNTDGTNNFTIANLPPNIKDIHVLSNTKLLYLADTNDLDSGKKIVIYDILRRNQETIAEAEIDFDIDDLILSPDKDYIAWWELKRESKTSKTLIGADSAVYLKNINTGVQNTVVNEKADVTTPIHYPLFFDKNNRLYLDSFIPNQGRGFYLGVSYVESENPERLIPVTALSKGKFSSQPIISPNDNKIAYLGFDPQASLLLDIPLPENLKRSELDNPNQVMLLDLDSFNTQVVAGSNNGQQYGQIAVSSDGNSLIYPLYQVNLKDGKTNLTKTNEVEIYNIIEGTTKRVSLPNDPTSKKVIDFIDDKIVYAEIKIGEVAHLGESYEPVVNKFVTFNLSTNIKSTITEAKNIQFLSYQPRGKYSNTLMTLDGTLQKIEEVEKNGSMQLSQVIVPELKNVENRTVVQNDLPNSKKGSTNPDSPTPAPTSTPKPLPPGCSSAGCPSCCDIYLSVCGGSCGHHPDLGTCPAWDRIMESGYKCYASPLYLYPENKTNVEVKPIVGNKIYSSWPPLTQKTWKLIASPNGELISDDKKFNKIEYSYFSTDITPPKKGLVVSAENINMMLSDYGSKLGLSNRELVDFVSFWTNELKKYNSPQFFVSHFDPETASKIMSFEINPKSDTFIQVIMYFKPLDNVITAEPPNFPLPPERKGFTVVDWSGIVDW